MSFRVLKSALCSGFFVITLALLGAGCATTAKNPEVPAVQASQTLREAERLKRDPEKAVGLYLEAAQEGLRVATDKTATPQERVLGQQIYDQATTGCVLALQKQLGTPLTRATQGSYTVGGKTFELKVVCTRDAGCKDPGQFDRFLDAAKLRRKIFKTDQGQQGVGGALVGVMDSERTKAPNRAPIGFAEPVTGLLSFGRKNLSGATPVSLSFYDPRKKDAVVMAGLRSPLRANFTAPLALVPQPNAIALGIAAMLRSDLTEHKSGIYFCEPYDPSKTPVLFVHGLMSSPHAWFSFINELNGDPEFRKHYQAWVFFYPTGGPIAANAYRLREALAEVEKNYPHHKPITLVGHSMGGILSQMQVTNSERILWDFVFRLKAELFYKTFPADSVFKKALIFKANPHISRVIFIATPHLGSNLANLRISSLAGNLIRMPVDLVRAFDASAREAVATINPGVRRVPTSIQGLSPRSPLLNGLAKLKITVPYNSIIGNQGKNNVPLAKSSDGVVPYWSSHLDGAESEIIVPTGHDAFDSPKSVTEVLRILAKDRGR